MLVAPRFLPYERPEGREPGHPEVLVRKNLVKAAGGVPTVDYDNLARLFLDDRMGFSAARLPAVSLYYNDEGDRSHDSGGLYRTGFRTGKVLHINAYHLSDDAGGELDSAVVMERLIRRARTYSLLKSHQLPGFNRPERLTRAAASSALGLAIGAGLAGAPELSGVGFCVSVVSSLVFVDKRGAHLRECTAPTVQALLPAHEQDIVFPKP